MAEPAVVPVVLPPQLPEPREQEPPPPEAVPQQPGEEPLQAPRGMYAVIFTLG